MPLDGHSYLVSQGWTGSGTGLRQGAISRPLAIPQKKTLAGLGKERDEAFPFWDHLFSAASKSIQIKISRDDGDSDDSNAEPNASLSLKRTSTGILSNRRPVTGAIAGSSGATTPNVEDTSSRLSLLATAKREAAKRGLYSRFFRGPVLGPDSPSAGQPTIVVEVTPASLPGYAQVGTEAKKRKVMDEEDESTRREQKRSRKERKELKEMKRAEKESREKIKGKQKESDTLNSGPAVKEKKKKRRREEKDAGEAEAEGKSKCERKLDADTDSEEKLNAKKIKKEKRKEKSKQKRKRPIENLG
ncbi:hypothetical protein B0H11DRAFT_2279065 [Mycena galericulata]|nr:hypothetical protein B0H11DRAFT_2279065 [Mycena galericulata]